MSRRSATRAAGAIVLIVAFIGCRELRIKDGSLGCSRSHHCPAPYACRADDHCWLAALDAGAVDAGALDAGSADLPIDPNGSEPASEASQGEPPPEVHDASQTIETWAESGSNDPATESIGDAAIVETPPHETLTVVLNGPVGAGKVVARTLGVPIDCGNSCLALLPRGTTVDLVASAGATGVFVAWAGCTSAADNACNVRVEANTTVTATFKWKNGNPCGNTSECASGRCVAGTCCDSACDGPCDATCKTGICVHQPARSGCGTVPGPNGTTIARLCDGGGHCATPTLSCPTVLGHVPCDLASKVCCYVGDARDESCTSNPTCSFSGQNCAATADCPVNQVCCQTTLPTTPTLTWYQCRSACSDIQLCDPKAPDPGCLQGSCQVFGTCQ
jgi:hypothetical protein